MINRDKIQEFLDYISQIEASESKRREDDWMEHIENDIVKECEQCKKPHTGVGLCCSVKCAELFIANLNDCNQHVQTKDPDLPIQQKS